MIVLLLLLFFLHLVHKLHFIIVCMLVCIGKTMVYILHMVASILYIAYRQDDISLFTKIPYVCYLSLNMNRHLELSDM